MWPFKKKLPIFEKGLLPSPPDERDYALSSVAPIIQRYPEEFPMMFDTTISHQGSVPSCVGHSVAGIKEYLELKEKNSKVFDGDWIYNECKKVDGIPDVRGTYLRTGLEILRKVGAKPINESDPTPYKIKMYTRNDENTFEGIKKAIALYGTVLAGFYGSNEGWRREVIRPPYSNETQWGHAVRLVAYDQNYLIGANSWGEYAHNKGFFKVPKNYLPFETWVVVLDALNNPTPTPIKTGWVAINWIYQSGGVWKTTANLNVREMPGVDKKILTTLKKGTIIQLTNSSKEIATGYTWSEIILK